MSESWGGDMQEDYSVKMVEMIICLNRGIIPFGVNPQEAFKKMDPDQVRSCKRKFRKQLRNAARALCARSAWLKTLSPVVRKNLLKHKVMIKIAKEARDVYYKRSILV